MTDMVISITYFIIFMRLIVYFLVTGDFSVILSSKGHHLMAQEGAGEGPTFIRPPKPWDRCYWPITSPFQADIFTSVR